MQTEKIELLGITTLALHQLCRANLDRIPRDWFQWTFNCKSADLARVTHFSSSADPALAEWCAAASAEGFEPLLLLGWGDALPESDSCAQVQLLKLGPRSIDEDDHRDYLAYYAEPDDYVVGETSSILSGGGLNRLDHRLVPPGFWAAYGHALRLWYENHPDLTSIAQPFIDFSCWQTDSVLGPDAFDLTGQHTFAGKPYFPMKGLPCCGIIREAGGELRVHGLLPNNWAFDPSGAVRARLAAGTVTLISLAATYIERARKVGQGIVELLIPAGTTTDPLLARSPAVRRVPMNNQRFSLNVKRRDGSAGTPVVVNIVQLVTVKRIPETEPFDLTSKIYLLESSRTDLEIGSAVNGAEPECWYPLAVEATIEQKVIAAECIHYVIRIRE